MSRERLILDRRGRGTQVSTEILARDDAGSEEVSRFLPAVGQVSTVFSQAWPLNELTRQWTLLSGEPLLAEGKLSGDSPPQEVNWNLKTINPHVEMRRWHGQVSECKGQN